MCLLAGTALSGVLPSGPPFPTVGRAEAVAAGDGATPEVAGRVPAAATPRTGRRADTANSRGAVPALRPLDINRADAADLQELPGVGPALAQRIVKHRETHGPFGSPADLLQVSGVGAKRYARLQGLIRTAEAR